MFEIIANMVVKECRIGTPRGRLSALQVFMQAEMFVITCKLHDTNTPPFAR
jgi:hypothetical protein